MNGDYLANVAVTLADAHGKVVLDTIAERADLLCARARPAATACTVSNEGQSQSREMTVSGNGAVRQDFYWAAA